MVLLTLIGSLPFWAPPTVRAASALLEQVRNNQIGRAHV